MARRNYYVTSLIALLLTYWHGDIDSLIDRIKSAQSLPEYGMPDPFSVKDD